MNQLAKGTCYVFVLFGAATGLCFAARSAWYGALFARPAPYWDQWGFVNTAVLTGSFSLADLFTPHNEHRIATSRILFLVDLHWFDLTNFFLIACIYCILAASALMMARLVAGPDWGTSKSAAAFSLSLGLFWSICQWENLSWGFQPQFPFVHLFALLSYWALARAMVSQKWMVIAVWTVLSCLMDFLAIFSLASGLFVLFPAVVLATCLRRFSAPLWVFAAFHVAVIIFFFLLPTNRPPVGFQGLGSPLFILQFICVYLGTLVRNQVLTTVPLIVGACGLSFFVIAVAAAVYRAVKGHTVKWQAAVALALAAFVVLEAFATALGRGTGGYLGVATASRYSTASVYFFAALLVFSWNAIDAFFPRLAGAVGRGVTFAVAVVLVVASNTQATNLSDWNAKTVNTDRATFALVGGVLDAGNRGTLYPDPDAIMAGVKALAEKRLGPYSTKFGSIYRPPLNALASDRSTWPTCSVVVDTVQNLGSGWIHLIGRISGVAHPAEGWVLAFNDEDRLLGFTGNFITRNSNDFDLFLDARTSHETLSFRLVKLPASSNAPVCQTILNLALSPLEIDMLAPSARVADADLVPEVRLSLEGDAKVEGIPAGLSPAARFGAGRASGTYVRGNEDVGAITFTIPINPAEDRAIAVPIMTGPGLAGLELIVSSGPKKISVSLAGRNPHVWRYVKIPAHIVASSRGSLLSIRLEDSGQKVGEWLGASGPYWVR